MLTTQKLQLVVTTTMLKHQRSSVNSKTSKRHQQRRQVHTQLHMVVISLLNQSTSIILELSCVCPAWSVYKSQATSSQVLGTHSESSSYNVGQNIGCVQNSDAAETRETGLHICSKLLFRNQHYYVPTFCMKSRQSLGCSLLIDITITS